MPDYQKPKAKALQTEALELREQARAAKSDAERAKLEEQALEKEREADRIENAPR